MKRGKIDDQRGRSLVWVLSQLRAMLEVQALEGIEIADRHAAASCRGAARLPRSHRIGADEWSREFSSIGCPPTYRVYLQFDDETDEDMRRKYSGYDPRRALHLEFSPDPRNHVHTDWRVAEAPETPFAGNADVPQADELVRAFDISQTRRKSFPPHSR